jgi:hypothetical protein
MATTSLETVLEHDHMMSGVPAAIAAQLSTCAAGGEEPTLRQVKCCQTSECDCDNLQGTLHSLHPSTP